ncbi:hypothetical protein Hanom_Chr07g00601961 [Helianthus anomalus]
MAQVIAWGIERPEGRFALKFSDRRRVKVKTIKAILSMDESVQRDILALGVPVAYDCERNRTVIRRLERKFPEDDDDVDDSDLPKVTSWVLDEQSRTVRVSFQHGENYSLTMDEVLNTDRLHLI